MGCCKSNSNREFYSNKCLHLKNHKQISEIQISTNQKKKIKPKVKPKKKGCNKDQSKNKSKNNNNNKNPNRKKPPKLRGFF